MQQVCQYNDDVVVVAVDQRRKTKLNQKERTKERKRERNFSLGKNFKCKLLFTFESIFFLLFSSSNLN